MKKQSMGRLRRFGHGSIGRQLTVSFFLFITLLMLAFIMVIVWNLNSQIQAQNQAENRQIALHITKELDSQIENMETTKRQFLYSADTMYRYSDYLHAQSVSDRSSAQNSVTASLYHLLNTGVPQLYCIALHSKDGSAICAFTSQKYSLYYDTAEKRLEALTNLDFSAGTTVLPPVETDGGTMICMLVRFVSPQDFQSCAILELQQQYSAFSEIILDATAKTEKQVLVYDDDGNVIYPLTATQADVEWYRQVKNGRVLCGMSGETEQIAVDRTRCVGWTVVVAEPVSIYRQQVGEVCRSVLLLGCLALLVCLLLVVSISRRLTEPLAALQKEVQEITLETLGREPTREDRQPPVCNEFEYLQRSFSEMRLKLQSSVDSLLKMEKQSSEAKLLALQSKMHPHFINNVLASIEIMAARGEMQKVGEICRHLSEMLTYSMQDYDGLVTLEEELRHATDYVELMKIRYPKRLFCRFEVEEQARAIPAPKMLLQPLIENSIKHGMREQPLHILVTVTGSGDAYRICVTDDGRGFRPEQLRPDWLETELSEKKNRKGGIGLNNIRQRLLLHYGDRAFMQLRSEAGQTVVEIGKKDGSGHETGFEINTGRG